MPRYGDGRGVAPEEQASRVIALGPGFPSPPTRSHSAGVRTLFISDAEAKDVRDAAIRDFLGGTDAA